MKCIALFIICGLVSACGQTGKLYLPYHSHLLHKQALSNTNQQSGSAYE